MLDTYQLQIFMAVVESGSYTEAARQLHLSQPAVSRQVGLLQARLGVSLFRRVGRRAVPSVAGQRLVDVARQVLALTRQVDEEMAGVRGEVAGVLRVGGSGAPAWRLLGRLLPAFRQEAPAIGFRLEALPAGGTGQALREGRLDLVVTEDEVRERGLACDLLQAVETVLAAPPGGAWEQRKRLPLRSLVTAPLILPATGTPARRFLEENLSARGLVLPSTLQSLEVQDLGAALPLVAGGLGVALLPRPLLELAPAAAHVVTLWPGFAWPLYLVRRTAAAGRLDALFSTFALGKGRALLR